MVTAQLILLLSSTALIISADKELRLLHVLSANKFYVPDFNETSTEFQLPNNLTYSYYLENAVDIPNSVMLDMFRLGEQLRNMYGDFIGSLYTDDVIKMQTVGYPTSMMSGELINAGLWPPVDEQIWKDDLAWQPVPFEYTPVEEDALLLGSLCPNFELDTRKALKKYYNLSTSEKALLRHIQENGKVNVNDPIDVLMLHLALDNSKELNQTLPEWLNHIYPSEVLTKLSLAAYDLLSHTFLQKRLNGGSLLKKIIDDSKSHINGSLLKDRKIHIYSGDDRNLIGVLKNLNVTVEKLPNAGDALIFELLYESNQFYMKLNYYGRDTNETISYTLIECQEYCPIEKFHELIADLLPADELSLCGSTVSDSGKGTASSIFNLNTILTILLLALLVLKQQTSNFHLN